MDAHGINTPDEMTRTMSHINIVKEAYRLLELEEVIPGRADLAGVHLEAEPTNEIMYDIVMANRVAPEIISAICLKAVHAEAGVLTGEEQIAFLQLRKYLDLLKQAADASRTRNGINSHFTLGSGSRIIRLLTSHGTFQAGGIA
jgi:predicted Zn-dependent protease